MEIKVFSTKANKLQKINVKGTTWGSVYNELENAGLINGDMKAVLRENNMTLESSNIDMPTTPYTIFVTPIKTKSGAYNPNVDNDEMKETLYGLLDDITELFEETIEKLDSSEQAELRQLKEEAKNLLGSFIDKH